MITWIPLLAGKLNSATDGGVSMREYSTVDPLKKNVHVQLRDPIPGRDSWIAFQIICHAFAAANNAVIHRIRKDSENMYVLEILIKDLHKSSMLDPFVDNWTSNRQKRKEEYMKYSRDKAKELEDIKNEPEPTSVLPSDPDLWCR